jgi:hypothetical protein
LRCSFFLRCQAAIGSDVALARLRILRDDVRRGEERGGVLADGPGRDRQLEDVHLVAAPDVLLARAAFDDAGRNRLFQRAVPFPVDPLDRIGLEPDRVDLARGPEHAGRDGDVEAFHVLEQERGPLGVGDPVEELAADRGDLPVLVHLLLDAVQLAAPLERGEVLAQVRVGHDLPPLAPPFIHKFVDTSTVIV